MCPPFKKMFVSAAEIATFQVFTKVDIKTKNNCSISK